MGARRCHRRRLPARGVLPEPEYRTSRPAHRRSPRFLSKRIDDLRDTVNRRFDDSHDLLKLEVKRIDDRLERLEHPIVRQS